MRIDSTHRVWLNISLMILVVSSAFYVYYDRQTPGGASGDTWIGLGYGLVAFLMMLFAGVLGARKKLLRLRVGSVAFWMRGHLWFGALCLPMAFFHGAFAFGGSLTTVMMVLTITVVVSGIAGAILQHALPQVMTAQVQHETTFDQIPLILGHLRREAYELVWAACGDPPNSDGEDEIVTTLTGQPPKKPKGATAHKPDSVQGQSELARFYHDVVLPYLRTPSMRTSPLTSLETATMMFEGASVSLDPTLHDTLTDLRDICEETRQKVRQRRLHKILHGWLLLHVPLSMALLVLVLVHAVFALYY